MPTILIVGLSMSACSIYRLQRDDTVGGSDEEKIWPSFSSVCLGKKKLTFSIFMRINYAYSSMPHPRQLLKGIWTKPIIICFNFWSALNQAGSWTGWWLVPSNRNHSIPFHSTPRPQLLSFPTAQPTAGVQLFTWLRTLVVHQETHSQMTIFAS